MIVNNIQTNVKPNTPKVNFKGMEPIKTSNGNQAYEFFLPYDTGKYKEVFVEFVQLRKAGTDFVRDNDYDIESMPLVNGTKIINPSRIAMTDQPFAYRFKLVDNKGNETYHTDSGLRTENSDKNSNQAKYVVVFPNRAKIVNPGGTIIHLMPDNHNIGFKMKDGELLRDTEGKAVKNEDIIEKTLKSKRNHFNQYNVDGSGIAGIIADIPELAKYGYDFILSTPLFGADERSSHGYWTSNPFQMTAKNGTFEDFKTLNVELFKRGMSLIADGAFVNEGMEGYRFQHIQKWGKESPYYNNFRITNNPTIENLPNVDPNSKEGKEILSHIKLNIVNGNHKYSFNKDSISSENQQKSPKNYTCFEIYDERLLSEEQKRKVNNGELIEQYDKLTTGNHYEINNNRQSVLLRKFIVPEDEVAAFEKRIKENQELYSSNRLAFLQTVLEFKNFNIGTQANGFETWDGNADIAKLRYVYSMVDEQNLELSGMSKAEKFEVQQGAFQNQDQLQKIGIYWTQITRDALVEYSAKTLKNAADVNAYSDIFNDSKSQLPPKAAEAMPKEVIQNVIDKKYKIPQLETTSIARERLAEDLMNLPLETIGFSSDITAVLGSPFISKKAFREEDISKTRYEFYLENGYRKLPDKYSDLYSQVDDFYTNSEKSLVEFAYDVVSKADTKGELIDKKTQELTSSGKLILPLIANDILKFAMIKSVAPDVKVESKNGRLIYDEKALKNVTLKNVGGKGISAKSPEDEAKQVVELMRNGLVNISNNDIKLLADNIKTRFQGVKEADIKMAYVLVDRTASGLNWRTDATKDTSPIGEVRDGLENLGSVMDESTVIWQRFFDGIKKINPNAYGIAEMTDSSELMELTGGVSGRHKDNMALERSFLHEIGASGYSNYTYFFSSIAGMLTSQADSGENPEFSNLGKLLGNLVGTNTWTKGFLFEYPQDGVKTSHNFVANHDKPRLLSILALDNRLFHGYLGPKDKPEEREANKKRFYDIAQTYTPNIVKKDLTPSYKALAMAKAIDTHIGKAVDEMNLDDKEAKAKLQKAIINLAEGEFEGKKFNPEAFGVSPIDFAIKDVIAQAKSKHNLQLTEKQEEDLFNKTFEAVMAPALQKMLVIDKIMTIMPGRNTTYSGDEFGATGYESPCKNFDAQNRNVANRDYINRIKLIGEYYQEKKKINLLRKDPELSALSNGETVMLESIEPLNLKTPDAKKPKEDGKPADPAEYKTVLAMFRYDKMSELVCLAHAENIYKDDAAGLEFAVNPKRETIIDKIDLAPQKQQDNTVIAGLVGGLAVGTYFVNAIKEGDEAAYGVFEEGGNYSIRKFKSISEYLEYAKNPMEYIKELTKKYTSGAMSEITLFDNITVLKNPLKKAAREAAKIAFKGNQNQNHIKIQAYLNSKQSLNIPKRNAI